MMKGAYIIGDSVNYACYSLFSIIDCFVTLSHACLDTLPLLAAFYARMKARPNIAAYLTSPDRAEFINGNQRQKYNCPCLFACYLFISILNF
jgi:hypothetical protein